MQLRSGGKTDTDDNSAEHNGSDERAKCVRSSTGEPKPHAGILAERHGMSNANRATDAESPITVHAHDSDESNRAKDIFKAAGADDIATSSMSKAPEAASA